MALKVYIDTAATHTLLISNYNNNTLIIITIKQLVVDYHVTTFIENHAFKVSNVYTYTGNSHRMRNSITLNFETAKGVRKYKPYTNVLTL